MVKSHTFILHLYTTPSVSVTTRNFVTILVREFSEKNNRQINQSVKKLMICLAILTQHTIATDRQKNTRIDDIVLAHTMFGHDTSRSETFPYQIPSTNTVYESLLTSQFSTNCKYIALFELRISRKLRPENVFFVIVIIINFVLLIA